MAFPGPHQMGGPPNFFSQPQVHSSRPSPFVFALSGGGGGSSSSGSSSHHHHHQYSSYPSSSKSPPFPSSSSSSRSNCSHPHQHLQPHHGGATDAPPPHQPLVDDQFDIFEWHNQFQSCVRYFLDHAQHSGPVQAVAAFLNIQLPFQKQAHHSDGSGTPPSGGGALHSPPSQGPAGPSSSSSTASSLRATGKLPMHGPLQHQQHQHPHATVTPYVRRLVATGFDIPGVLHGFFGDDWVAGIGPLHEAERRNYLFAAKSDSWLRVKASYDEAGGQTVPFLKPLQGVSEKEIVGAESSWSEWLAMQDWMLGPRAPPPDEGDDGGGGGGGRREGAAASSNTAEVRVKTEVQSRKSLYHHPQANDDDDDHDHDMDDDIYGPAPAPLLSATAAAAAGRGGIAGNISASNLASAAPRVRTTPRSRKRRHRPGASMDEEDAAAAAATVLGPMGPISNHRHHHHNLQQQRQYYPDQQEEAVPAAAAGRVAELRWDVASSSARTRKGKAVRLR